MFNTTEFTFLWVVFLIARNLHTFLYILEKNQINPRINCLILEFKNKYQRKKEKVVLLTTVKVQVFRKFS